MTHRRKCPWSPSVSSSTQPTDRGGRSRGRSQPLVVATLAVAACLTASAVAAHRAQVSLTTVEWNTRTRSLEVIHRVHLHDAQRVLDRLESEQDLVLAELEGRARFALYAEAGFSLQQPTEDAELSLTLVGAEIEDDHILVFQEIELPRPPAALRVTCTLLRDLFEDQQNHVNLRIGQRTRTLRFSGQDGPKLVRFPQAAGRRP